MALLLAVRNRYTIEKSAEEEKLGYGIDFI